MPCARPDLARPAAFGSSANFISSLPQHEKVGSKNPKWRKTVRLVARITPSPNVRLNVPQRGIRHTHAPGRAGHPTAIASISASHSLSSSHHRARTYRAILMPGRAGQATASLIHPSIRTSPFEIGGSKAANKATCNRGRRPHKSAASGVCSRHKADKAACNHGRRPHKRA